VSESEGNSSAAVMEPALRGRAAVMAAGVHDDASLMDPAHKALIDALKIT
jgi:hypothetical protein